MVALLDENEVFFDNGKHNERQRKPLWRWKLFFFEERKASSAS